MHNAKGMVFIQWDYQGASSDVLPLWDYNNSIP